MDENEYSELLNNTKDLTIGQIFKIITKIKYKIMVMFIATFVAITGSAYMAGQSSVKQEAAVMLQSPFSMRINIDGMNHDFNHLTLMEDPMMPSPDEETMMLSLREIKSAFDIVPLGQVIARVDRQKVPALWKWLFSKIKISEAHAQPSEIIFDWNGHSSDMRYKERHVEDHKIHRYYTDECILEYILDSNRRSVPKSFFWIKRTH